MKYRALTTWELVAPLGWSQRELDVAGTPVSEEGYSLKRGSATGAGVIGRGTTATDGGRGAGSGSGGRRGTRGCGFCFGASSSGPGADSKRSCAFADQIIPIERQIPIHRFHRKRCFIAQTLSICQF
jgi:hypothetical protein